MYVTVEMTRPSRPLNADTPNPQQLSYEYERRGREGLTDMHLPLLPLQLIPAHREAHALRLHNMQRLQTLPDLPIYLVPLSLLSLLQFRQILMLPFTRRDPFPCKPKVWGIECGRGGGG